MSKINRQDSIISEDSIKIKTSYQQNDALTEQIERLNTRVEDLSYLIDNPSKTSLPLIPNPPPQPTSFLILDNKILKGLTTYSQVDSVISSTFAKNKYNKFYIGLQCKGFAIATTVEEILPEGTPRIEERHDKSLLFSFFRNLFSQEHLENLLFSKTGFYRCVIIIVSPNLYSLGGKGISGNEIKSWIDADGIKAPAGILNTTLDKETAVVVLLYEFQQNENVKDLKIIDEKNAKTKILDHPIVKALYAKN